MDADSYEGSKVLEQLAEADLLEDFYEAVDADNFSRAILLMRKAQIDEETIEITVAKMQDCDGNH